MNWLKFWVQKSEFSLKFLISVQNVYPMPGVLSVLKSF